MPPFYELSSAKVLKEEGLIYSVLKSLSLSECRKLWKVHKAFHRVLDAKVIPLLALYEHDWSIVSHYMDSEEGLRPRFEYNCGRICVEALLQGDFAGLQLLARRKFDFQSVQRDSRLIAFARKALRAGRLERLFLLRTVGFDYAEVQAECSARNELADYLLADRSITIDFLGLRLSYRRTALSYASTDYVDQQLALLCADKDSLSRVPFVMAAFILAGTSPCYFLRPNGCGYLLLVALASESFNFVYLLVRDAIHLEAVFKLYDHQLLQMAYMALESRRLIVLELLAFCGYTLGAGHEVQQRFDGLLMHCLEQDDFPPLQQMCRLGLSLRAFAERNLCCFQAFVQSRLDDIVRVPSASLACAAAGSQQQQHTALRRLAALDGRALELHFQSATFLEFAGDLVARKSFVALRQIVAIHPAAFEAFFAENFTKLEEVLLNAFMLRDIALVVDFASLSFPMLAFFTHHQAVLDAVLLNSWLPNKHWMELSMLKNEIRQWSFPAFFERNRERSDAYVVGTVENGYWFDFHNLAQLCFGFPSFFDRCFAKVSTAVLNFFTMQHPHFVMLRELSALSFPWSRFMEVHGEQIVGAKDHDFLQFVISLRGFEVGSQVYNVVEQTRRLYHSMAASMLNCDVCFPEHAPACPASGAASVASLDELPPELLFTGISPRSSSLSRPSPASSSRALGGRPRTRRQVSHADRGVASQLGSSNTSSGSTSGSNSHAGILLAPSRVASAEDELCEDGRACASRAEAARALKKRARELVRKAREKKLETRKVLMLMFCKGAYCWNPLKVHLEEGHGQEDASPTNTEVESVLNFLDSREESLSAQAGQLYTTQLLPHYLQPYAGGAVAVPGGGLAVAAMPLGALGQGGGPMQAAVAAAAAAAVAPVPPPVPPAAAAAAAGAPPPPAAAVPLQVGQAHAVGNHQLLFHVVCITQRSEERTFSPKIDFFWNDVLRTALPLASADH